jgi:hypothetical protein
MSLRANTHDTVVLHAVPSREAFSTVAHIGGSLNSVVFAFVTSDRVISTSGAVMSDSAQFAGVISQTCSVITEVTCIAKSLFITI